MLFEICSNNLNFAIMKHLILLILIIPIFLISCRREPVADFYASTTEAGIGETIVFTNRSSDGNNYEWNFGDGFSSTKYNASHYYDEPGNYIVTLKAFGKDGYSEISVTVHIYQTYLEITVEEYEDPFYLVPDISVRLYPTIQDWENETNLFAEGFTDANGKITFSGLYPQRYYVDVYGPNHDNYDLAAYDAAWIETDVIIPGIMNYFIAVVDYYAPELRNTKDTKILKSLKKSSVITTEPRLKKNRIK